MPARSVAWMSISPLRASSGVPLTSMLTTSLIASAPVASRRHARAAVRHTHAVSDVELELLAEMLHEALYRPGRRVAECADRVTFDLVRDIDEHVELLLPPLTVLDAADHPVHPAGAF